MGSRYLDMGLLHFISLLLVLSVQANLNEDDAWRWFDEFGQAASLISNKGSKIAWNQATNITDYNEQQEVCTSIYICITFS